MADHVDTVAITGNQWDNRGFTVAPVNVNGTNVAVAGNTSGNDGRVVATLDAPTKLTATSGDHVYFLSDGAGITLPDAAGNTCRITVKNTSPGGCRVATGAGQSIDRHASVTLAPGETAEVLSDGTNWHRL